MKLRIIGSNADNYAYFLQFRAFNHIVEGVINDLNFQLEEVPYVLDLVKQKPHENFKHGNLDLFWSGNTNSLINIHDFYEYNNLMVKA